jgi:hypothetical protein
MRLGEKEPATVSGNAGTSSTSLEELANIPEVLRIDSRPILICEN